MKVKQNIISFILGMAIMLPVGTYATTQIMASLVDVPVIVDGTEIDTTVYNIDGKNYTSVRDVAEAMGGTVEWKNRTVYIETPKTDIEKVVEKCKDSCVMIYVKKNGVDIARGSGFIYNGYIVTVKHLTNVGDRYTVYIDDDLYGTTATLVNVKTDLDIAVLDVNAKLPSVTLGDSDSLKEGQKVIAIASPSGVKNTVDECFYHGETYTKGMYHLGISDSNIDDGSSGGAVFDTDGNLIGMIARGVNGNGAAIPVNAIKPILEKLK